MAVKTIADLLVDANVIKNATIAGENTATRVGNNLVDIIDSLSGGNYQSYTALLSQTGVANPVVTVCANTIGSIVWTRIDTGSYQGTLAGAFPATKRWAMAVGDAIYGDFVQIGFVDDSTIQIWNYDLFTPGGPLTDDTAMYIEIRVYP